jgi:hypothetical protein
LSIGIHGNRKRRTGLIVTGLIAFMSVCSVAVLFMLTFLRALHKEAVSTIVDSDFDILRHIHRPASPWRIDSGVCYGAKQHGFGKSVAILVSQ